MADENPLEKRFAESAARYKSSSKTTSVNSEENLFGSRFEESADRYKSSNQAPSIHQVKTSLWEDLARGFKRSSLATPFVAPGAEESDTFGGRLAESAGELAGDIPAMSGGGLGGALGGAALGSFAGPIGTALGGLLGAGAGMMAAPTAVKSTAREVRKGSGVLDAAGNVISDVAKSGIIGAATGAAGRFAGPLLGRVGGKVGEKVLSTGVGRGVTEAAGELLGMTGAQKVTGEDITAEGLAKNALLLGGMKGAGALAGKLPVRKPKVSFDLDALAKAPSAEKRAAFNMVKEHVGERAAKVVESSFDWREKQAAAEKKNGSAFTDKELEEMMYYRQETGNPNIKGDTYEDISKRLTDSGKEFADKVMDEHFAKMLKANNDNIHTRKINPRDFVKENFFPGIYDNTPEEIAKVMAKVAPRFRAENPFANKKTFLNYHQALVEGGLKPLFKNIVEGAKYYDEITIKTTANAEFASKIMDMKGKEGKNIIVTTKDGSAYDDAIKNGWTEFYDPFLKGYGDKPALIDPEFAPALQGVFQKRAYRPEHPAWKYYDAVADTLKRWAVHLPFVHKIKGYATSPWSLIASPFHAETLGEHAIGDYGVNFMSGVKGGIELLKNKEAVVDAVRHGVQLHRGDVSKQQNYLFGTLQPGMKLGSYNKSVQDVINKLSEKGTPPNAEQITKIKRDAANYVNNVYGGQNWETISWFNDKDNLKWMRRGAGYLDWSVSNIRNAAQFFGTGPQGNQSRKMWAKYALFHLGTRALVDAFNSSLIQTDKDKSPLGIRLDPKKFMENLSLTGKKGQRYLFSLPDIDMKLGPLEFNPGRDEKGHRQYGHLGKSALEVMHMFTQPLTQLFNKSNPVIQAIFKQVVGGTPAPGGKGIWTAQGVYKHGTRVPWGGKEGYEQVEARAKELGMLAAPFALRSDSGVSLGEMAKGSAKKYASSFFGMYPINKGMTPNKATDDIRDALKHNNVKELNEIKKVLLYNGYTDKQINKVISEQRSDIKKAADR